MLQHQAFKATGVSVQSAGQPTTTGELVPIVQVTIVGEWQPDGPTDNLLVLIPVDLADQAGPWLRDAANHARREAKQRNR